jgi:surfactin synthase thioesterase subunit
MKRKNMLSKDEWNQAMNAIQQMSPIELKKLHIQQTKAALRDMPELADQIQPILDKLRNELLELKLEVAE